MKLNARSATVSIPAKLDGDFDSIFPPFRFHSSATTRQGGSQPGLDVARVSGARSGRTKESQPNYKDALGFDRLEATVSSKPPSLQGDKNQNPVFSKRDEKASESSFDFLSDTTSWDR